MDKQPRYDIKELADKWMNGTITPEEKAYFEEWYNHFNFEEITLTDHWAKDPRQIRDRIARRLQDSVRKEQEETARKVQLLQARGRKRLWWSMAAILATMVITAYFVLRKPENPAKTALNGENSQPMADIPPAAGKAVLILANGSTILLDSATTGNLAAQGGTTIEKREGNTLSYRAAVGVGLPEAALQYNTISVPRGGQYNVVLPDGTRVWLNAASALKFPVAFTGADRIVELSGEAYFEVAKMAAKPFKVVVPQNLTVQVLGTHFNISAYADEAAIATTLLEGKVLVKAPGSSKELAPGQAALYTQNKNDLLIKTADTAVAVAWKNGAFKLSNTSVNEVLRQISRWYDVDIVFNSGNPESHITGTISRQMSLSNLLKGLEAISDIHFEYTNGKILVSEK